MKRQQKQIIIDIMNFDEEKGFYAAANLDVDYLKAGFERLRGEVMQSDRKIVSSERLNNLFDKKVFLQLIDHILSCIQTIETNAQF